MHYLISCRLRKYERSLNFSIGEISSYFDYDVQLTSGKSQKRLFFKRISYKKGSLSTVVGDEKLTSREDLIGLLFFYVQSD